METDFEAQKNKLLLDLWTQQSGHAKALRKQQQGHKTHFAHFPQQQHIKRIITTITTTIPIPMLNLKEKKFSQRFILT